MTQASTGPVAAPAPTEAQVAGGTRRRLRSRGTWPLDRLQREVHAELVSAS
jgi:hypothetical protein